LVKTLDRTGIIRNSNLGKIDKDLGPHVLTCVKCAIISKWSRSDIAVKGNSGKRLVLSASVLLGHLAKIS